MLSWRVSITLDSAFCIAAVEEALAKYGCPAIFNTDQGEQCSSTAFTGRLLDHGIRISMD
ncbi:MAG: transposase family protein, partial [Gemmatimonadetes bacterium]|nr:transposase family protein [Gemmatimonadota bacterium]